MATPIHRPNELAPKYAVRQGRPSDQSSCCPLLRTRAQASWRNPSAGHGRKTRGEEPGHKAKRRLRLTSNPVAVLRRPSGIEQKHSSSVE